MRLRSCKIIATMGPASDPPERIHMLCEAGADAFRINFSHGEAEQHQRRIDSIRQAEAPAGRPIPIIADLQGPKIRVGTLPGGALSLRYGQTLDMEAAVQASSPDVIPLPHQELFDVLVPGDVLKLDDGRLQLTVVEVGKGRAKVTVDVGGKLTDHKGVNLPGRTLPISALTQKDRVDLDFALNAGVDFIALSFVQTPEDVEEASALIGGRAKLIVKLEKPSAIESLEKIVALSDALMIARGDLGVELPPERVPVIQRRVVSACRQAGKPVIVATHMLESMIEAPTPTRAEASDVATAVYQGADAVMLSAESAVGRHPQTAVAIMDRIIKAVEADPDHWAQLLSTASQPRPTAADAISFSARNIAQLLSCKAILAFTNTGSTALRISRERPHCRVLSLTAHEKVARQLSLAWGVHSVITQDISSFSDMIEHAEEVAVHEQIAVKGDTVVVTAGLPFGRPGTTNMLKIIHIGDGFTDRH